MCKKQKIILDGEKLKAEQDIHDILKKELDFPDYYGNNIYALWDMLTAWIDGNVVIIWKNFKRSEEVFSENWIHHSYEKLFKDAEKELKKYPRTELKFIKKIYE